ncbi:MAG: ABC transporter substrate-binding protein [Acidimicrobiia bacterium]|nr:ABC transporter substrate-binding protein [Acidimicrobiia bacterium]
MRTEMHVVPAMATNSEQRTGSRAGRWRRPVALMAVMGIVATACGRSDDAASDDATGDRAATTTPTTLPAGPAAGEFGDLGQVCGPAPAGTTLTASDTGVTATSIQIGTVADPGYVGRPGINQELFDTAQTFSKWCNAAGGIFGREIEVKERDAKFTEHQARMIEACDEGDFMLVGGLGVFDDLGQKERLACGLPNIGFGTNPPSLGADLRQGPSEGSLDTMGIGDLRWLDEKFPEATQKIGFLTGGVAVTQIAAAKVREATDSLGWEVVYDEEFNPAGETSWRGFVEGMKSAGVRGFIWTADPSALASVLNAMAEIEFHPDFIRAIGNNYDNLLLSGSRVRDEQHLHRVVQLPVPRSGAGEAERRNPAVPGPHGRVRPGRQDRRSRHHRLLRLAAVCQGRR